MRKNVILGLITFIACMLVIAGIIWAGNNPDRLMFRDDNSDSDATWSPLYDAEMSAKAESPTHSNVEFVSIKNGKRTCVDFSGDSSAPTTVIITNCGDVAVGLRSDKQYLPLLTPDSEMTYDIPVGYREFEAAIYDMDSKWIGGVELG